MNQSLFRSTTLLIAVLCLVNGAPADSVEHQLKTISGYLTVDGAVVSSRENPIPIIQTYGPSRDWLKQPFRLALVLVEFSDVKHDPVHDSAFYDNLIFARGRQFKPPTTRSAFGSLADWYAAQSHDRFELSGKTFDWVAIDETYKGVHAMTRREGEEKYLRSARTRVLQRDGIHALDGYDGLFFIHAGPIGGPSTNILWSHRWVLDGVRYLTTFETETINVSCHEFGHMLGLPDLYAKPGVRESVGPWCTMATGFRGDLPGSFCVWSKATLGWCQPTVIDADRAQKLVLRPIQTCPNDAFIIRLNSKAGVGAEFLLLENRAATMNDVGRQSGLLIWRVIRKADRFKEPDFALNLPGPDDASPTSPAAHEQLLREQNVTPKAIDRRVAWPSLSTCDYQTPRSADDDVVAIRNIHLAGGNAFFEITPVK